MVRRWCLYLAALLGCVILLIAYQGWLAWLLLMAVLWLPLFSLAVSLPAMLTARIDADCGGAVAVGDRITGQVTARCRFPMPAYRCVLRVKRIPTGESWVLKTGEQLPTEHCGKLECIPGKCYMYDYLNLFRLKVRRCGTSALIVEPQPVKMTVSAGMQRQIDHGWKPKPGGGFAENHELRLYRPGDSLNQVHWKLTAKTGKLTVREAMEPVRRRLVVMLEIRGDGAQLDIKMGKLLWLGRYFLQRQMPFEIQALTARGTAVISVGSQPELREGVMQLLCAEPAREGQIQIAQDAAWSCYIGGGTDET